MSAGIPILLKLGVPLGLGLFLLGRGKSTKEADDIISDAVDAMQRADAKDLEHAFTALRPLDATTADLLQFQQSRMIARGTRGFTDVPLFTDDGAKLKIDNQEIAVRLIQLEGRAKALDAWAKAYSKIGAKMLAQDLKTKAAALRGKPSPKGKGAGGKKSAPKPDPNKAKKDKASKDKGNGAATPDLTDVVKQVTDALASGSVEVMRKVAADLRAHGYTEQADSLDAAANELEAQNKEHSKGLPTPPPVTHRVFVVSKQYNSESAITKKLLGKSDRWKELVAVNVPKDADGRSRQKVTVDLIESKDINPNRLGGLYPGLQPDQRLYIPDSWPLNSEDTHPAQPKPIPTPDAPKPKSGGSDAPDMGDALTQQLITMLIGKSPGKEDSFLVKKWQQSNSRTGDGKYGPGDAIYIADKLGTVPPSPLYWPKKDTQKSLTAWHQEMSRLAVERPNEAEAYTFADHAGRQPGFEGVPTTAKIVSRRYGDGLGSL